MIKVILKEDVIGQGKKNDIVDVSDGFARNFLIPNGKAIVATPDTVKIIEIEKTKSLLKEETIQKKNVSLKEKIETIELVLQKNSKEGKLFGSISAKEISEALEEKSFTIDPKKIIIDSPIKSVGLHNITILLDKNIKAGLKINVVENK